MKVILRGGVVRKYMYRLEQGCRRKSSQAARVIGCGDAKAVAQVDNERKDVVQA